MRRITRPDLLTRVARYLRQKQQAVDAGADPRPTWAKSRKTKSMRSVAEKLASTGGPRSRCMYCEDSRGTDIEHFRPMASFPKTTFVWENLLWACTGCNRAKGDRFDVAHDGTPLLIDPTSEDPWDYLYYEPHTGMITARFDPRSHAFQPKGEYTAESGILPLNIEAVTEGRRRIFRSLRRAVQKFLDRMAPESSGSSPASRELLDVLQDHDDFGLLAWCFLRDGSDGPPFSELRTRHPDVWQFLRDELTPEHV